MSKKIKYKVVDVFHLEREFPLQATYGEALDLIRKEWMPDWYYDNPICFKFTYLENGNTEVVHPTATFRIEKVRT